MTVDLTQNVPLALLLSLGLSLCALLIALYYITGDRGLSPPD